MREGWDYILFEDYQKDMEESSQRAGVVIQNLVDTRRRNEQLIAALIHAADRIEVPDRLFYAPGLKIRKYANYNNQTVCFEAIK